MKRVISERSECDDDRLGFGNSDPLSLNPYNGDHDLSFFQGTISDYQKFSNKTNSPGNTLGISSAQENETSIESFKTYWLSQKNQPLMAEIWQTIQTALNNFSENKQQLVIEIIMTVTDFRVIDLVKPHLTSLCADIPLEEVINQVMRALLPKIILTSKQKERFGGEKPPKSIEVEGKIGCPVRLLNLLLKPPKPNFLKKFGIKHLKGGSKAEPSYRIHFSDAKLFLSHVPLSPQRTPSNKIIQNNDSRKNKTTHLKDPHINETSGTFLTPETDSNASSLSQQAAIDPNAQVVSQTLDRVIVTNVDPLSRENDLLFDFLFRDIDLEENIRTAATADFNHPLPSQDVIEGNLPLELDLTNKIELFLKKWEVPNQGENVQSIWSEVSDDPLSRENDLLFDFLFRDIDLEENIRTAATADFNHPLPSQDVIEGNLPLELDLANKIELFLKKWEVPNQGENVQSIWSEVSGALKEYTPQSEALLIQIILSAKDKAGIDCLNNGGYFKEMAEKMPCKNRDSVVNSVLKNTLPKIEPQLTNSKQSSKKITISKVNGAPLRALSEFLSFTSASLITKLGVIIYLNDKNYRIEITNRPYFLAVCHWFSNQTNSSQADQNKQPGNNLDKISLADNENIELFKTCWANQERQPLTDKIWEKVETSLNKFSSEALLTEVITQAKDADAIRQIQPYLQNMLPKIIPPEDFINKMMTSVILPKLDSKIIQKIRLFETSKALINQKPKTISLKKQAGGPLQALYYFASISLSSNILQAQWGITIRPKTSTETYFMTVMNSRLFLENYDLYYLSLHKTLESNNNFKKMPDLTSNNSLINNNSLTIDPYSVPLLGEDSFFYESTSSNQDLLDACLPLAANPNGNIQLFLKTWAGPNQGENILSIWDKVSDALKEYTIYSEKLLIQIILGAKERLAIEHLKKKGYFKAIAEKMPYENIKTVVNQVFAATLPTIADRLKDSKSTKKQTYASKEIGVPLRALSEFLSFTRVSLKAELGAVIYQEFETKYRIAIKDYKKFSEVCTRFSNRLLEGKLFLSQVALSSQETPPNKIIQDNEAMDDVATDSAEVPRDQSAGNNLQGVNYSSFSYSHPPAQGSPRNLFRSPIHNHNPEARTASNFSETADTPEMQQSV